MATTDAGGDVEVLVEYLTAEITEMHAAPDGWPGHVELALIDAVLSIRAVYGVSADTGVRGAIKRYKDECGRQSWKQKRLSTISSGIQPTNGWDATTNTIAAQRKRQADVYVFVSSNRPIGPPPTRST